jgi:DNA-directed RNA polymerase subunit RPC12/RpoP
MGYSYSDTCDRCGGDAITREKDDGTQIIDCQECDWTEVA